MIKFLDLYLQKEKKNLKNTLRKQLVEIISKKMVRNQGGKKVKNSWSRAFTITTPRKETELLPCISISHPCISLPTQVNSLTTQCWPLYLLSYFRRCWR